MRLFAFSLLILPSLRALQNAEADRLRSEVSALKQTVATERSSLTSLQKLVAEQSAAAEAALSNLTFDLNSTRESLAASQRDATAAQSRVLQLQADVKVHQDARKSAESKYQSQLQVCTWPAPC